MVSAQGCFRSLAIVAPGGRRRGPKVRGGWESRRPPCLGAPEKRRQRVCVVVFKKKLRFAHISLITLQRNKITDGTLTSLSPAWGIGPGSCQTIWCTCRQTRSAGSSSAKSDIFQAARQVFETHQKLGLDYEQIRYGSGSGQQAEVNKAPRPAIYCHGAGWPDILLYTSATFTL